MAGFQSFICYSHKDTLWKEYLCDHLASVELNAASAWHDGNLHAGDDFEERIFAAIDAASLAIILVSEHSLSSEFITQKEVPRLLARRKQDGLRVIPVVVRACAWRTVNWLAALELRPKGGTPLSSLTESDAQSYLAELAEEIHRLVRGNPPTTVAGPVPLAPVSVSTGRLPPSGRTFVGRDGDLTFLDNAWQDSATNMVTVTAWAGVGKSALVNHWLGRMRREKYRGAERVFGWSFDGQGGTNGSSADPFLHAALSWFGESNAGESSWEKGERLAQAVQRSRSLLVLDGLEPLQHPPGPNEGRLREDGLRAFLCSLAESNLGLCVVTSREPILELAPYEPDPAQRLTLNTLGLQTGTSLLRSLGVQGKESELAATVQEYEGHCLALTLLGSFLTDVFHGDVRRRHEVGPLTGDERLGAHARRVLSSYESWFGDGAEVALLSWLSLMERPTDEQMLAALCRETAVPSLSEPLSRLSPLQWRQLLGRLQRSHLLRMMDGDSAPGNSALTQNHTLYLHPLIREHFRERLRARPRDWQAANERLFEYCQTQAPQQPETLEEMTPLYDAVRHGCWAGRKQEALQDIYWPRIRRGNQGYSTRKLGAFQADVAALANFFERPFTRLAADLAPQWRAPVLGWTGFRLYALGRLEDASHALKAGYDALAAEKNWPLADRMANHLFLVSFSRGEFRECQTLVDQMLSHAETNPEVRLRLWQANYGLLLWNLGRRKEAEREFRKATPDDEISETHPLVALCEKLPIRQTMQLVYLMTEGGDSQLAFDYTEDTQGSFIEDDAYCSGIPLGAVDSDFELELEAAESDFEFPLEEGSGIKDADENPFELAADVFDPSDDIAPPEDLSGILAKSFADWNADVTSADEQGPPADQSGSDVKLVGPSDSGSDVKLVGADDAGSAVRDGLPTDDDAGSDAKLGSLAKPWPDDSDVRLAFDLSLHQSVPAPADVTEEIDLDSVLREAEAAALSSDPTESLDDSADVSRRAHDSLRTLLRAHAEVVRREAESLAAENTSDGAAGSDSDEFSLTLDAEAVSSLDSIVQELRRVGLQEYVVLALLIRARHRRLDKRLLDALQDLADAQEICLKCGLKLLGVDVLLAIAEYYNECNQQADARQALVAAAQTVKQIGYYCQAPRIQALARRLPSA